MRKRDSSSFRVLELRAQLRISFLRFGMCAHVRLKEGEVAVFIQQTLCFVARADGSPSKVCPLAVERKVDTKVRARMCFRPVCDFGEPGAGNQDAGRSYPTI